MNSRTKYYVVPYTSSDLDNNGRTYYSLLLVIKGLESYTQPHIYRLGII